MMPHTALSAVSVWHAALAANDPGQIAAVTHLDVEVTGPRGSSFGVAVVQDWVLRSGIRLEPRRWFARGDQVVVEQEARWPYPDTGDLGEPVLVATAFTVDEGLIRRISRYPDPDAAFAASGLSPTDEQFVDVNEPPPATM